MGEKRAYKSRKPGGRKKLKPEYDAGKNLKEQMDAAATLYGEDLLPSIHRRCSGSKPYQSKKAAHHGWCVWC